MLDSRRRIALGTKISRRKRSGMYATVTHNRLAVTAINNGFSRITEIVNRFSTNFNDRNTGPGVALHFSVRFGSVFVKIYCAETR